MSMDTNYDVIVVGAGPAGASAAKFLCAAGLRVLICERSSLPRLKMCAGGLTPEAYEFILERVGEIPERVFSTPRSWQGLRLEFVEHGSAGNFLELNRHHKTGPYSVAHPEIPTGMTCVWRDRLDNWLAEESGADIRDNTKLIDFEQDGNQGLNVRLCDERHDTHYVLGCSYLIGADGAVSTTRQQTYPGFDSGVSWFSIYEEWYEGSVELDPNWYYIFLNDGFADVFASFFSKDEYLVFTTVSRKGGNPKQGYRSFIDYQKRHYRLSASEVSRHWGCVVNNMGARGKFAFGSGRVLLAGEAAGFIGFCGEGMSGALVSGQLAAQAISSSFENPPAVVEEYRLSTSPLEERIYKEHQAGRLLPGKAYSLYMGK